MTDVIIAALIAAGGSILGSYIVNIKNQAILQEQIKGLKEDFGDLRVRVDKHNHLVERVAIVEQSSKAAHKRIDEMVK